MTKRVGKVAKFLRSAVEAFIERLPGSWAVRGNEYNPRLVRPYPCGVAGLQPSATPRAFPSTNVSFSYGLIFDELSPLIDKLDEASGFKPIDFFHVYQDTFKRTLAGSYKPRMVEREAAALGMSLPS